MNRRALPAASVWQRLGAFAIDLLIVLFILALVEWTQRLLDTGPGPIPWIHPLLLSPVMPLLVGLVLIAAILASWTRLQGTPGALLMGIKLVDERTGDAPDARAALRRLLAYVPAIGLFLLGILAILWDRQRRGWHDRLSHTHMVQDDDSRKNLAELMREAGV